MGSTAGFSSSDQSGQALGFVDALEVGAVQPQGSLLCRLHLLLVSKGHGPVQGTLLVLIEAAGQ